MSVSVALDLNALGLAAAGIAFATDLQHPPHAFAQRVMVQLHAHVINALS